MTQRRTGQTWRLSREQADILLKSSHLATRLTLRPGQLLYQQGEVGSHFYLILSGEVLVSIFEPSGFEMIMEVMGPWALCGEGPAFDGLPRFSTATALRKSEVLRFDVRRLGPAFAENPALALSLLQITALKQRNLAVRLEYAFGYEPDRRILQLIERLAELYSDPTPEGRLITVQLTHEQIANMTGTSRVTVTRVLNRLRRTGAIDVRRGLLLVRAERRGTDTPHPSESRLS
jgi:CRP/FNR family cyclic AMP-dependent transcriptional regulator